MNAEQFEKLTGYPPQQDDLERVNCPLVGQPGHHQCGVCPHCGTPRFTGCYCTEEEHKS